MSFVIQFRCTGAACKMPPSNIVGKRLSVGIAVRVFRFNKKSDIAKHSMLYYDSVIRAVADRFRPGVRSLL